MVEYESQTPDQVVEVMKEIATSQIGWMNRIEDKSMAAPMLLIYVLTMYMRVCDEQDVDLVIDGARKAAQSLIDDENIEITPIEVH